MYDRTLPIGSVVLLKNGNKRAMIIGYYQYKDGDRTKIYDYVGVGYPEGFIQSESLALFDHSQIEILYAIGHQDAGWPIFQGKLAEAIAISDKENGRI